MKNIYINKIIVTGLTFSALVVPPLALAQTPVPSDLSQQIVDQALQNTGNSATTNSSNTTNTNTTATTNNDATIIQAVNASANTGHNEANRNISIGGNAGVITTGDALINVTNSASVNSTATGINNSAGDASSDANLYNTDKNLTHDNSVSATNTKTIRGHNNAVISQVVNGVATTGDNVAERNISLGGNAGVIATGNAGIAANYLVAANQGVALVGGTNEGNGPGNGASIVALNTGDSGRYTTSTSRLNSTALSTYNNSSLFQSCGTEQTTCTAITGDNTADRNISKNGDAGVVTTGNAVVSLHFLTDFNNSRIGAVQSSLTPQNQTQVDTTGDNLLFNTNTSSSNTTTATTQQNATANQAVTATADTGHNTANRNISFGGNAGVITTGNALITVYLSALANGGLTQLVGP